jgi:phenylacetic acid degradation operon negative regulatory protein
MRHDTFMGRPEPPLPPPSARSLLMTVLGEFAYTSEDAIWTSSLITVMRLLGVDDLATRQAVRRTATAGWIERERRGKSVGWRLAAPGREAAAEGRRRAQEFVDPPAPWDGRWFSLFVSAPDLPRAPRRRFHGGLTWLRLGNPMSCIWVSPRTDCAPSVRALVEEFGLTDSTIGLGGRLEVGLDDREIVELAWDLSELTLSYERLLQQYRDVSPVSDDELLVTYLELRNLQQRFIRLDPMLPAELSPNWIGRDAATLVRDRVSRWELDAGRRWHELLRDAAPPG